jgi:PAS domain S-box-containing protein
VFGQTLHPDGATVPAIETPSGTEPASRREPVSRRFAALAVCLGYYLAAKIGFALTFQPNPISVLWPPNALLLSALLLTPKRLWWLIIAAALPAHLVVELESGVPTVMVMGWFVSNCAEALLGAACIRALVGDTPRFDTFRHVGVVLLFGVLVAPFVSSFLDAAFVTWAGWGQVDYGSLVRRRFLSNALAALALVPALVTWVTKGPAWLRTLSFRRLIEPAAFVAGLLVVSLGVFQETETEWSATPALLYVPLPFLLWAALRLGPLAVSTGLLIITGFAVWGAIHGLGPFVAGSAEENAVAVQLFLIVIGVPKLLLMAGVAERRRVKDALQASETRFATVFRASPDPMVVLRPSDGVLRDVNDRWQTMFGYTRADVVGRTSADLAMYVNPDDRRRFFEAVHASGSVRDFEAEMFDRHGQIHFVSMIAETIDIGGETTLITVSRDLTDQRRAERDAREQRRQLAHLNRAAMLGELSGALAHELNQPLGAILCNVFAAENLVAREPLDTPMMNSILHDIAADSRRAADVIRHLRAMLQGTAAEPQIVRAADLIEAVLHLSRTDLHERGVPLETRIPAGLPDVSGDPIQLQQVLLNLVINACDAMNGKPPGECLLAIQASTSADGSLELAVIDRGVGIPEGELDRVFEPFRTTKVDGLGLGLPICRSIVAMHGGRIWAAHNAGPGVTFHVSLPAVRSS